MRDQLATHLSQLKRDGLIEEWSDQQILAGSDRVQAIDQAIHSAQIILSLISAEFLALDACYQIEMQQALERHRAGVARVIPIIARPCDWEHSPFAHLQCLPRNGKPITTWDNQDEALTTIANELRRIIEKQQFPSPSLSSVQQLNRAKLLKRVRTTWIEGLLEHSLHHAAWIDLHLQEQMDALENPWRFQVQELDRESYPLPIGTNIVQVYDEADGELLILGEPGAGKTTLLLQLTQALLNRAEVNEQFPLPVLFNLSSWSQQHQSLSVWLIEELWGRYQVPDQVGQQWIKGQNILPLLDGLDEVPSEVRLSCMQTITAYLSEQREHGMSSLVVCCRNQEYIALTTRLPLSRAISILPLTTEQIENYLSQAQGQLDSLRQVLSNDRELANLASSPLMLNIFTMAYQRITPADLLTDSLAYNTPSALFDLYVHRMLMRRRLLQPWTIQQFLHWLSILAKQMDREHQTIFSLEKVQPNWLPGKLQHLYRWGVALVIGVISGLIGGLIGGLVGGLTLGLTISVISGLTSKWGKEIQPAEELVWSRENLNESLGIWVFNGLLVGLLAGPVAGGAIGSIVGQPVWLLDWHIGNLSNWLIDCLVAWVIFGLFFGVISFLVFREHLSSIGCWIFIAIFTGIILLCQAALSVAKLGLGMSVWLIGGLAVGVVGGTAVASLLGLLVGLFGGLSTNQLTERDHLIPNEGIRRSAKNGLIAGLIVGLTSVLIFWLIFGFTKGVISGLLLALVGGLIACLAVGFIKGLGAFVQHFVLRIILQLTHIFPWSAVNFLDEAAERLLLRKVGGSYIFVHRLLLEYFASIDEPIASESTSSEDRK